MCVCVYVYLNYLSKVREASNLLARDFEAFLCQEQFWFLPGFLAGFLMLNPKP